MEVAFHRMILPKFTGMKNRLFLHIGFWCCYVLLQTYMKFAWISGADELGSIFHRWMLAMEAALALCIIKIPFSYFVAHLLNRAGTGYKKVWAVIVQGTAGIIVAIFVYRALINYLILPYIYSDSQEEQPLITFYKAISSFLDLILLAGIVVAINQYRRYQSSLEKQKLLTREKLESELKFLRAQMNPHFLFNTLNNIYALARKRSDDTPEVVMRLSKILRFMLYESRKSNVPISEELRLIQDYIELERIRYNDRLTIRFDKSIDTGVQPIAPLILLPFVDNAFKHGASETRFNSYIDIVVILEEGNLIFSVENLKGEESEGEVRENIGLSNVRRQLELMYPEHELVIENGKSVFRILLKINLLNYAEV